MSPSRLCRLTPPQAARIDSLCDAFELEWIAGGRPRLEEVIPRAEEQDRPALLEELLALELEQRIRRGEWISPEEYQQRLPGCTRIITDVFAALPEDGSRREGRSAITRRDSAVSVAKVSLPSERYQIVGLLGQGGMGTVYRARDKLLGRTVALKVIRPDALGPGMRSRFAVEARAVAQLDHPHIIKIFDIGDMAAPDGSGSAPYLTLEYVPGGSLARQLAGPLEPALAARLVALLARAMQHAHARRIIYRDLKPDNVLLAEPSDVEALNTRLGSPRITDFGLAREVKRDHRLTRKEVLLGTPGYLAPEQAESLSNVGPLADVYALGVILYRLLTGRMPFEADSVVNLLFKVCHQPPTPPRQILPTLPEMLEIICLACLEKTPERRPGAGELAGQLERFRTAELAGPLKRLRSGEPGYVTPPGRASRLPSRRAVLAGLAGAVALGGVGVWRSWPRGSAGNEPALRPLEPLRVVDLEVKRFAVNPGARTMRLTGVLGRKEFETRLQDQLELEATLSRPGYAWLIAFRPDGKEEVCFPESEDEIPGLVERPRYPSKDRGVSYELNEETGLHVFVVVASSRPLPSYRAWRAQRGEAPWRKHPPSPGVVWLDDGGLVETLTAERGSERGERGERGKGVRVPGRAALVALIDWLRARPEVEAVLGVGFAVLPREGP
jgi:serine/threonine protein kinase